MNATDIQELTRRLKTDKCTPRKLTGCCVAADNAILSTFNHKFITMEENEQQKYLDIVKKTMVGKYGNNTVSLEFQYTDKSNEAQNFLLKLRDSDFEDEKLLSDFYEKIIATHKHIGPYAIIMMHDVYDIPEKGTDGTHIGESTMVYDYITVSICPIKQTKAGLIYDYTEEMIKDRYRDWMVEDPEAGFVYPAFTDRQTDIYSILYHIKDTKEKHEEFVSEVIGCQMIQTIDDKKETFSNIIAEAFADEKTQTRIVYDINESLREMIETESEIEIEGGATSKKVKVEDIAVSPNLIKTVLEENEIEEEKILEVQESIKKNLTGETTVNQIIDRKLLAEEKHKRREEDLLNEIAELKKENRELRARLGLA